MKVEGLIAQWPTWAKVAFGVIFIPAVIGVFVGAVVLLIVAEAYFSPLRWAEESYYLAFFFFPILVLVIVAAGALAPRLRLFSRRRRGR